VAGLAAYSATKKNNGKAITPIDIREQLDVVANPLGEKVGPGVDNIKYALEDFLAQDKAINYEGASGNVDFDEKGDVVYYNKKNGDVIVPFEIWCYNNGKIETDKICEVATTTKQVVCKEPTPKPS